MDEYDTLWEDEGIGLDQIVIQPSSDTRTARDPTQRSTTDSTPIPTSPVQRSDRRSPPRPVRESTRPITERGGVTRRIRRGTTSIDVQPERRSRRRPNILERRSEALSSMVTEPSKITRRTNKYVAADNTTMDMKMAVGHDIQKKDQKVFRTVQVEDPDWHERIDFNKLFASLSHGGYAVGDIRTLVNKTQLVNLDRSIWDRNRLLTILVDYLIDRDLYDEVKMLSNLHTDWMQRVVEAPRDIIGDHYSSDPVWESVYNNMILTDNRLNLEPLRTIVRSFIEESEEYYESTLIDPERSNTLVDQLGNLVFGDILYLDSVGNDNFVSYIPPGVNAESGLRINEVVSGSIDDLPVEGRYNLIILDHALDYTMEGREIIDQLRRQLRPNGRLVIISYDYGYNALDTRFRNPTMAYSVFDMVALIDHYLIPPEPHIDPTTLITNYPDEPQLRSWTRPLSMTDSFVISEPGDPLVEIARVYSMTR